MRSAPDELALVTSSASRIWNGIVSRAPHLFAALVVLVAFIGIATVVRWAVIRALRSGSHANVGLVLGRIAYFAAVLVGLLVAVTIVAPSMTPAKLVSMLGIGGVALGLAFKDLFQNMVAGILLLWRQPFRIGDEIVSHDYTGTVEAIETRATFIRTYDGKRIIIPNSQIFTDPVSVITAYDMLRTEYDVGIGYGDDIARAKEILEDIFDNTEGILRHPAPDVLVWDLAESTVNLRIRWWSRPDRATVLELRDRVLHQVRTRFKEANVDLPYPTQVLLFHDQTEEVDGDRRHQREGWPPGSGYQPVGQRRLADGDE